MCMVSGSTASWAAFEFQDRCLKPLGHPAGTDRTAGWSGANQFAMRGFYRHPLLDVRLALLGYAVEWDKAGLPTAARSISGRAIVASSLIRRRFLRDLEAVGRGEDPKAVIRDP
jgi:hypothetical protein